MENVDTSQILDRAQEEIELRRSLESTVPVIWEGHDLMGGQLWGSTYGAAIFAFVPRKIWPDKPRGPGSIYAQNFLGEVREGLAVPVNSTAEEYWNFGLLGVILISALYGALIRHAHNFYVARQDNPFVVGAFVLFVTTFHPATDDLVLFEQQMALLLIVLALAFPFAARKRRSVVHPPANLHPTALARTGPR
jgi:TM2 domain-containing membrane protein YozV